MSNVTPAQDPVLRVLTASIFPSVLYEALRDRDTWHHTRAGSVEAALQIQHDVPMLRLLIEWESWRRTTPHNERAGERILNDLTVLAVAERRRDAARGRFWSADYLPPTRAPRDPPTADDWPAHTTPRDTEATPTEGTA